MKLHPSRKLFFGLFIFPLLVMVGMAFLLFGVIFLTAEPESPESLIQAIKTGSPSKRWQKAFELSNELQRENGVLRDRGLMNEIIHILKDTIRTDSRTRSYMAMALGRFEDPEAVAALREALRDPSGDVRIFALFALGNLGAREAINDILPLLGEEDAGVRKAAVYLLGILGSREQASKLLPLLEDPQADVRWNAALSLARLGRDEGRTVLLQLLDRRLLKEQSSLGLSGMDAIRVNAIKGLALLGDPMDRKVLEEISKRRDESLAVRQAAISALSIWREKSQGFNEKTP